MVLCTGGEKPNNFIPSSLWLKRAKGMKKREISDSQGEKIPTFEPIIELVENIIICLIIMTVGLTRLRGRKL